jgi:hypothetical protein
MGAQRQQQYDRHGHAQQEQEDRSHLVNSGCAGWSTPSSVGFSLISE